MILLTILICAMALWLGLAYSPLFWLLVLLAVVLWLVDHDRSRSRWYW